MRNEKSNFIHPRKIFIRGWTAPRIKKIVMFQNLCNIHVNSKNIYYLRIKNKIDVYWSSKQKKFKRV